MTGIDFSENMLQIAREKAVRLNHPNVRFVPGDALDLPVGDDEVAAATIAFGMRNLADHEQGFRELVRVVRPGGRVVCLEITTPGGRVLGGFYRVWFDRLVPAVGNVVDQRRLGLLVPAGLGAAVPRARRARQDHVRGRPGARAVPHPRRRHHRPARRRGAAR